MGPVPKEGIGGKKDFWLYSKSDGFDLTYPETPTSPAIYPRLAVETTTGSAAIDPSKTALVIIDLQNYFLSPLIGRPHDVVDLKAVDQLLRHAIPACRKAEILIVWLNWSLTEQDIEEMPPTIIKGFAADVNFDGERKVGGLGSEVGSVKLADGSVVNEGRVLMRDQWNAPLYSPLEEQRRPQDLWIHKDRLSGFWGGTAIEEALNSRGVRTLLSFRFPGSFYIRLHKRFESRRDE